MDKFIGEIAALTTSVAWSFTSIFFTIAGKEVGSLIVNRTRLLFAILSLGVAGAFGFHWIGNWRWHALSGIRSHRRQTIDAAHVAGADYFYYLSMAIFERIFEYI